MFDSNFLKDGSANYIVYINTVKNNKIYFSPYGDNITINIFCVLSTEGANNIKKYFVLHVKAHPTFLAHLVWTDSNHSGMCPEFSECRAY